MSSAFSFGFEDDDAENTTGHYSHQDSTDATYKERHGGPPKPEFHSLADMVSTFPSYFTYSFWNIDAPDGSSLQLPRRDLLDIRTQLMAEDPHLDDGQFPILGLSANDITPTIYEGGFKTWECAADLARYLLRQDPILNDMTHDLHVIELGAGTGLPTMSIFQQWLRQPRAVTQGNGPQLHLAIADYNHIVLALATIPNLFLAYHLTCKSSYAIEDVEVTSEAKLQFLHGLSSRKITVSAISGGWSPEFLGLLPSASSLRSQGEVLILASETVYSPDSLQQFIMIVLHIIDEAEASGVKSRALVAAKKVYFGVGGGSDEFLSVLRQAGGNAKVVWHNEGVGVGRVILEVTKAA